MNGHKLQLVHPKSLPSSRQAEISATFAVKELALRASFSVSQKEAAWVNPALSRDGPQWGLWDWDVVELFVASPGGASYYEFQVSPLGQSFELEIHEPRKKTNPGYRSGFTHRAVRESPTRWTAALEIPLRAIGFERAPDRLWGNAFAILGKERTYWSLFTPPQEIPDFHVPRHFQELPIGL